MRTANLWRGVAAGVLLVGGAAYAAPTIALVPPDGARFAVDQRFDIRVEVTPSRAGTAVTTLSLAIDGKPMPVATTDLDGSGGVTIRNLTTSTPGPHRIVATATEAGDAASAEMANNISVLSVAGGKPAARNLIILLGDGMGASHRTAARIVRYGVTRGRANGYLAMDQMPGFGMVNTHSLNSIVTDSAPGMSSYVSGSKNNNGQEGVWPDNSKDSFDNPRIEYLSEFMHRKYGKSLGLVSTADIEDATPAANAVHTSNRGNGTGICDQYLDEAELPALAGDPAGTHRGTGLSVLMGGGRRWFLPAKKADGTPNFGSSRAEATDYQLTTKDSAQLGVPAGALDPNRDLIADFQKAGFAYAASATDLKSLPANTNKLLGLFAYGNMNVSLDKIAKRRNPGALGVVDDYHAPDQPMLDEMATAALNVLNKNPQGFVLMIEGAHIDKQSHLMDADRAIWETIEFDSAVRKCLEFAQQDGNTTVIVTADHECSGFSIIGAANMATAKLAGLNGVAPLQGAVGTYDAAGFPHYEIADDGFPVTSDPDGKLLIGFGASADRYENWLTKPLPVVDSLLPDDIKGELKAGGAGTKSPYATDANLRPEKAQGFLLQGNVAGTQAVHTASDIPLSAFGPGWTQFVGVQDNTDVFFKLLAAAEGGY